MVYTNSEVTWNIGLCYYVFPIPTYIQFMTSQFCNALKVSPLYFSRDSVHHNAINSYQQISPDIFHFLLQHQRALLSKGILTLKYLHLRGRSFIFDIDSAFYLLNLF